MRSSRGAGAATGPSMSQKLMHAVRPHTRALSVPRSGACVRLCATSGGQARYGVKPLSATAGGAGAAAGSSGSAWPPCAAVPRRMGTFRRVSSSINSSAGDSIDSAAAEEPGAQAPLLQPPSRTESLLLAFLAAQASSSLAAQCLVERVVDLYLAGAAWCGGRWRGGREGRAQKGEQGHAGAVAACRRRQLPLHTAATHRQLSPRTKPLPSLRAGETYAGVCLDLRLSLAAAGDGGGGSGAADVGDVLPAWVALVMLTLQVGGCWEVVGRLLVVAGGFW
jgi:hypothetical protein